MARALIIMGVSGSGKSTVGGLVAQRLGWEFLDADDFHPPANVAKMADGIPLNDQDRAPWLHFLRRLIADRLDGDQSLVLACSALKSSYRKELGRDDPRVSFVYLKGTPTLVRGRLERRSGHFMSSKLLESQFEVLEEPEGAFVLDVSLPPDELAAQVESHVRESS